MAKVCDICGRGTSSAQQRSHSNIKTKRQVKINLQTKKVNGQSKKVCTSCIKSMAKT